MAEEPICYEPFVLKPKIRNWRRRTTWEHLKYLANRIKVYWRAWFVSYELVTEDQEKKK